VHQEKSRHRHRQQSQNVDLDLHNDFILGRQQRFFIRNITERQP
jgi:hypothetical protein